MAATQVAIIDSGGANIASLQFAIQRLGVNSVLTSNKNDICNATHIILPGVGAAADAMHRLHAQQLTGLMAGLSQPVLGICLGMQLLAQSSEEDATDCLCVVPGIAKKMQGSPRLRVPNMGWCPVRITTDHPLLHGIDDGSYFYFIHSFALPVQECAIATALHATEFTAILAHDNFYATQFHPERSAAAGARLLKNFLQLQT